VSRADSWVCWARRGMGTARRRRLAFLRPVGRAWRTDPGAYRLSDLWLGRVPGLGFVLVKFGQGRRPREGRQPGALGLWDQLPSGLGPGV
jgi:hypothetical protein